MCIEEWTARGGTMTSDDGDWVAREANVREMLREQAKKSIKLRTKDREFHGLEREFRNHTEQMLIDYERTRDIKHPRDVGNARENLLRIFLRTSGYLPQRYGVSDRSVRVVSHTGHMSNEIDLAFFDSRDSFTLMNRQNVYEVYPIESVYRVVQIKSLLNAKELTSALNNLATFKTLERPASPGFIGFTNRIPSQCGFAMLFAYKTDMQWGEIVRALEAFARSEHRRILPNAVHILDSGFFLFGDDQKASCFNQDQEAIRDPKIHGFPDREALGLFHFYSHLLALMRATEVQPPELERYFQLPLIAADRSYSFVMGMFAEVDKCERHGDFARRISSEALEKLVTWCGKAEPINWIKANDIAYGLPENEETYRRQPGDVRIYNPEGHPLGDVLLMDSTFDGKPVKSIAYDMIDTAGVRIFLPYYYSAKEGLISGCPKCVAATSRAQNRKISRNTTKL
jgi:hypothetical protein